jgi:hypothetical protein
MILTQDEFEAILNDASKYVKEDIFWRPEGIWFKFRTSLITKSTNYSLFLQGTHNPHIPTLSYTLICPPRTRIYALDLGKDHRNPDGELVGEIHKHRWSEVYHDKQAYCPLDITACASDPIGVWKQFCDEAMIDHNGVMHPITIPQDLDLFP